MLKRMLFIWFVVLIAVSITPTFWWGQLLMVGGSWFVAWGIAFLHQVGRTYGAVVFFILVSLGVALHPFQHAVA